MRQAYNTQINGLPASISDVDFSSTVHNETTISQQLESQCRSFVENKIKANTEHFRLMKSNEQYDNDR